jgi:WD40 repeat protein/serine/threonine protein kinase
MGDVEARGSEQHVTEELGGLLFPGKTVDCFKVVRLIGRGGMSEVYLARDVKLGRKVALKVVHPESLGSAEAIERFLLEARTTALFSHPHIVTIYAVGEERGKPYVALEYLEGQTLRQRMDEDRLSLGEALRTALAIAEALRAAHEAGVLHRDLKPENVMIPKDGRLRVLDFGLAKTIAPRARTKGGDGQQAALLSTAAISSSATADTVRGDDLFPSLEAGVRGTPAYMAPEQWREEACSEATDVWAFGVLLHELVTGERPYRADSLLSLACKVTGDEVAPAPILSEHAPPELAPLIARCLEKSPAARPAAAALVLELGAMLHGPAADAPPLEERNPFRGLQPFTERHARLFFGREAEIGAFVERLREQAVLPVVGPSGAGKSSFVQAGVIPRLRELGAWHVVRVRPGSQPFVALATRLEQGEVLTRRSTSSPSAAEGEAPVAPAPEISVDAARALARQLHETPSRLALRLQQLAEEKGCRVLLLVDQLEELCTLCEDEEQRRRFMQAICTAADDPAEPVRVIFTLRDDYLGRLAEGHAAREALGRLTVVRSPGHEALEQTLTRPLEAVGYRFDDPALIGEMVASVRGEPAPLPLLQFATHLLWDRRDQKQRLLLRAAYEAMGGVAGALAEHADGVLEALTPEQVRVARELLLRLVTVDGTRRVLARERALEGLGDEATLVLDRLTDARLIAVRRGQDDGRGEGELELVHESLIASWGRLRRWIDESREEIALLSELGQAAELWARRGRRDGELWHGEPLEDARRALERHGARVPAEARSFVEAGLWRARRRTRALRLATAAVILGLCAVALFLAHSKRVAERQKDAAGERWAEAQLEGARAAAVQRNLLEARAKLRGSLETRDSLLGRALWRRLRQDALIWRKLLADSITEVAFSPDGLTVAAACLDTNIYLLDARTMVLRATLKDPHDQVFALGFSPDGRLLAAGTREGWLRMWNLETAQVESNRRAHATTIWALAFAPDGRELATASDDATLRTWELPAIAPRRVLRGHGSGAHDLAYSPDGRRLVSGGFDGTVRAWDVRAGGAGRAIGSHTARIYDVAVSPDGRLAASAGSDAKVHLTDLGSGATRRVLAGHLARVLALAFSPDGRWLASGSADQTVRVWRVATGELEKTLIGHTDWARYVAFSPDGRLLASGGPDKSVVLWDATAPGAQRPPAGHGDRVLALAFSPDGGALATGGADRSVRFWDVRSGDEISVLGNHSDWVRSVAFSPDGKLLASAGSDQGIRIWDLSAANERQVLLGQLQRVHGLAFSPDGGTLASASGDRKVRLWDLARGTPRLLEGHTSSVKAVAFSPDGKLLASASEDRTVRLWEPGSGRTRRVLEGSQAGLSSLAFSPDGKVLLTGGHDHAVRLWDLADGRGRELGRHRGRVHSVAFGLDGRRAASAGAGGEARLWDLERGGSVELVGHRAEVNVIRFAPRGELLATASSDGTVRLWRAARGEPAWFASALVTSPTLLAHGHRGWLALGVARRAEIPAPAARWAAAIADRARRAALGGDTVCIATHDGALEIWDRVRDARLLAEAVPGLRELVASPAGCFVLAGARARLYRRAGSFKDLADGATALSPSGSGVLVVAEARVRAFGEDGAPGAALAGARGARAALLVGSGPRARLVLGFDDGRLEVSALGARGARRPVLAVRDAPSSPVLRLAPGPAETLLVGHENGYLALRSLGDGSRLDESSLHGPIAALEVAGSTAVAASELGDILTLDLGTLPLAACDLLREVWARVPVVWESGQPVVRAPPRDHPCAR